MEISVFSKCIKYLIGSHDKVEVPGLGIFFAEKVPSAFLEQLNTITPPSRRMYFEKAEVEPSAGSLIFNHISSELGVTADQAEVELTWCLGRIRSELDGNRICVLPELGQMKATSQHDYFFVPDDNLDICPESFGLTPVCLRQSAEQPAEPAVEPTTEQPAEEKKTLPEINLPEDEQGKDIRTLYEGRSKARRSGAAKKVIIAFSILILIAAIAAALMIFLPDSIVDRILYTPEELQLIHSFRL